MTDAQKRRIQLLQQTRSLYSDRKGVPAVHPRYQSIYKNLYGSEEKEQWVRQNHTLGIRIFISALLFALFVIADYKEVEYADVNSTKIVHEIKRKTELDSLR